MLELFKSFSYMLEQTASERKLTFLYLLLFFLFLMMLILDARTKKQYTGPKPVKNIIVFLIFLTAVGLLLAYFRL